MPKAKNPAPISTTQKPNDGQIRAVIDSVHPSVDGGRHAVKRVAGDVMQVDAHCYTDGHDALRVMLDWRKNGEAEPHEVEMRLQGNDVWRAHFTLPEPGDYVYGVTAWVDSFVSWHHELARRVDPDDIQLAAQVGAILIDEAAARAKGADRRTLNSWASRLRKAATAKVIDAVALKAHALDETLAEVIARYPDRQYATRYPVDLPLMVDRERARYSTWYELFPRSASPEPGRHGTFKDVVARLPYVAEMGFDVLYFPPIHPVGRDKRKGKNNGLVAGPDDVGSPWAIGAAEGGHKSILPELGTPEDFRQLVAQAREFGIDIALDIAFQCAPDHPYVLEHPSWFKWRPDGTVQYAENPPKKYQDIYPFNFESDDWRALWDELKSVFDHWIGEGVRIFRVDNPHTKSFAFWEWVIAAIRRDNPDVIFLAEAFTRPKVMHGLAKIGYSQSYTYFTWRNTKQELTEYFTELAQGPGRDYYRPNAWPNTPDILNEHLHGGRRATFMARLALAATLSANYGIYGPTFELLDGTPREPGSEEYLNSEKYQVRHWDLEQPHSLRYFIARINAIRREHRALQDNAGLEFLSIDNEQLIAYLKREKRADGPDDVIITVVNLDPHHAHSGWLGLDLGSLDLEPWDTYQMHDLLSNQRFEWKGSHNFVMLDPQRAPVHIFKLRRHVRREHDFDYFV